jgi:hypothetical protein
MAELEGGVEAVFYSLAFGGSPIAPVQLARNLESLRLFDAEIAVFVFLFGEPPPGFLEMLRSFNAEVRQLGDHRAYIARTEPDRAELFALDPKLHRWLVLEEPELKASARLLYIDSDTLFFAPPRTLFDRYRHADLFAREEPCSRRSIHGYDRSLVDEEALAELRASEELSYVPPFNTGVCLVTRKMADAITMILPRYFDYLLRFLAWFQLHPLAGRETATSSAQRVHERFLRPASGQALPYPGKNRWIADQYAMWLALGKYTDLRYGDFSPNHVWQGGEFQQMSATTLPILCHYFGGQGNNTKLFFDRLVRLPRRGGSQ